MKRFVGWASAAVVAVGGLVACGGDSGGGGGGGGSSPVGQWTIDMDKSMGPIVEKQLTESKKQFEKLPPDQRAMAEKMMPTAEKFREIVKEQFAKLKFTFEFKSDHTATMSGEMGGPAETGAATWTQSGNVVTVTPTTKNGKPVSGEDAKPKDLKLEGGYLTFRPGEDETTFYLKRK